MADSTTAIDASRALGRDRTFYIPKDRVRDFGRTSKQAGELSTTQPIRLTAPRGLTGLLTAAEVRTPRGLLNNTRELARGTVEPRKVSDSATIQFSRAAAAEADGLRAALRNTNTGITARNVAGDAYARIAEQLRTLSGLATTAITASTVDRAALSATYATELANINTISNQTLFRTTPLINGVNDGAPITTAGRLVAEVAQTTTLAASETLTFEDFGIFAGLTAAQRSITLASGSSQTAVVSAINAHVDIGSRITASVDQGKLVLTSNTAGTAGSFRVSSDRGAAPSSTGIGTVVVNGKGTDATTSAASVTAVVAQTANLTQSETLTFADFGIFAGLSNTDRQVAFAVGDSQSAIVSKINNEPVIKDLVTASVDASGKLLISAKQSGAGIEFQVSSNRAASSSNSGIGTATLEGDGTSNTDSAPFVQAQQAQTTGLSQSETLTFGNTGLFTGLRTDQRQITFAAGTTQQNVVNAINGNVEIGGRVTASVDAVGRLLITADFTGADVYFEVVSNRGFGNNRTNIGDQTKQGNNAYSQQLAASPPELGDLRVDVGAGPRDDEPLDFDTITATNLKVNNTTLATAPDAQTAVLRIEAALNQIARAQSRNDVRLDTLARNAASLTARRSQSLADAKTAYRVAVDVRRKAVQNAADVVVAQASIRTPGAYQALLKTTDALSDRFPRTASDRD